MGCDDLRGTTEEIRACGCPTYLATPGDPLSVTAIHFEACPLHDPGTCEVCQGVS